jgi:hypothetical protein
MRRIFVIATLAVLVCLVVQPAHLTGAQTAGAVVNFTVYVSEAGLNDTSGNLTLGPVLQGDTVMITFIWNDSNNPYNAHQLEIGRYNVTSEVINAEAPNSVVQFVADMAGTFKIYCVIPCLGMANMQNGWLVVMPAHQSTTSTTSNSTTTTTSNSTSTVTTETTTSVSTTSTATTNTTVPTSTTSSTTRTAATSSISSSTTSSITATKLSVLSMYVHDGELLASVGLNDSNGTPIAGVEVHFSIPTDFGKMPVGSNLTQPNGTADIAYQLPSQWGGLLYAYYSGSASYGSSNVTAAIEYDPTAVPSGSPYVSGQGNYVDLRLVGVPPIPAEVVMGIFLLVLASVYGVIAFALIHVLGIRKRKVTKIDE